MKKQSYFTCWLLLFVLLLAANTTQAQLADSPWPMFRHDLQHTGRSPYIGPAHPYVIWNTAVGGKGIAICPNGRIVVASKILAPNGTVIAELEPFSNETNAAIDTGGTIYSVGYSGVYAYDFSGKIKWIYRESDTKTGCHVASPTIGFDGTIYCIQSTISVSDVIDFTSKLLAINHSNGKLKWEFSIPNARVITSPAIASDGTIYIADQNFILYAINPTGVKKWSVKVGDSLDRLTWHMITSPTIGTDGTVYIAGGPLYRYLYAVKNGIVRWKFELHIWPITTPAIGPDGVIYINSAIYGKSYLYAINQNGTEKWHVNLDIEKCIDPVIGADGVIYIGALEEKSGDKFGYFYAINPDGSIKWSSAENIPGFPVKGLWKNSAIGNDGTLYLLTSSSNNLYAVANLSTDTVDVSISAAEITFNPHTGSIPGKEVKIYAKVREETGTHGAKCRVSFYRNNKHNLIDSVSTYIPAGDTSTVQVSWKTTNLAAGRYTIIAAISHVYPVEVELSNNEARKSYPIFNDSKAPVLTFNLPTKDALFPIKGEEIKLSFSDEPGGSGIYAGSFRISNNRNIGGRFGGKVIPAGTNLANFFQVTESGATLTVPDSMSFPIGQNTLIATVVDSAGNEAKSSVTFNADIFVVSFPADGAFVNQTPIKVRGFAIAPFVKKAEINGMEAPIVNDTFEKDIDLQEGANQLTIIGYDSLNNIVKEIKIKVYLDSIKPVVRITSPINGQSFSYSPISIKGTAIDKNLLSVHINGFEAKISGTSFILGESHAQGLEIGEGGFWIKAVALDSTGNKGIDSIKINGVPPSPRRLYLKDNILNWFPFPAYPPGTTEGYSTALVIDTHSWKLPLKGDINGSNYEITLLVGCLGAGSAEMKGELILRQNQRDIKLVTTPNFIGSMAGPTPIGYWRPVQKSFTISGINPDSVVGDTLIFKVTKVSGDRIGLIFIQELNMGYSWLKIPDIITAVEKEEMAGIPDQFILSQNYPNPFNPETTIKYQLPEPSEVTIRIFNITGQVVKTILEEHRPAGYHSIVWDGKDDLGNHVSSGVYFYQLCARTDKLGQVYSETRKMVLVR